MTGRAVFSINCPTSRRFAAETLTCTAPTHTVPVSYRECDASVAALRESILMFLNLDHPQISGLSKPAIKFNICHCEEGIAPVRAGSPSGRNGRRSNLTVIQGLLRPRLGPTPSSRVLRDCGTGRTACRARNDTQLNVRHSPNTNHPLSSSSGILDSSNPLQQESYAPF